MRRYKPLFEYMTPAERKGAFLHGQTNLDTDKVLDRPNYKLNVPDWAIKRWKQEVENYSLDANDRLTSKQINNKALFNNSQSWRVILLDNGIFWADKADNIIHSHLLLKGIIQGLAPHIQQNQFSGWNKRTPKNFVCLTVEKGKLYFAESYLKDFGILDDLSFMKHFDIKKLGFDKIEPVVRR